MKLVESPALRQMPTRSGYRLKCPPNHRAQHTLPQRRNPSTLLFGPTPPPQRPLNRSTHAADASTNSAGGSPSHSSRTTFCPPSLKLSPLLVIHLVANANDETLRSQAGGVGALGIPRSQPDLVNEHTALTGGSQRAVLWVLNQMPRASSASNWRGTGIWAWRRRKEGCCGASRCWWTLMRCRCGDEGSKSIAVELRSARNLTSGATAKRPHCVLETTMVSLRALLCMQSVEFCLALSDFVNTFA